MKNIFSYATNLTLRIKDIQRHQKKIMDLQYETIWANIYHDCIKGNREIESLPLNIGRFAGNYTFFYVLFRIMTDKKPKRIIEFGLGESSKFISTFIKNDIHENVHTIVEHDENWQKNFEKSFSFSAESQIVICPLITKNVKGFNVNSYQNIENTITEKYDLYVVDGPFGSERYSRYDIVGLLTHLEKGDDFIVILDDYHRSGEKDTLADIENLLKEKGIASETGIYRGEKSVAVVVSEHNKYFTTL
ncbi:hypothetical protein [Chryseobacterium sp. R2A-55]|uniref:hypothetical protein n=1 Tax=Chryseobacterium sp. R2A-55 TaxID=2744445 RepID=UPI001F32D40D|nr:hypothetical protein [Chryseobacterium sp. R2A-55]